ncbi:MAG: hypothetical protein BA870_04440 [Desulfuromonadales bacterium C00003094]|nr:MAG: hypothetical protein BA870_04440 [Desulfuromonadales bacterium C00003094]OEU77443.1 MAG: hypothetical protein BA869_10385 [Desulfuromonadales bacterium C00003107]
MGQQITIIEAGRTFAALAEDRGDFTDWVGAGLAVKCGGLKVVAAFAGEALPSAETVTALVITGSHAMVTERQEWNETFSGWLARVVTLGVPVLGICFGHQLLAQALGGTVGDHPGGGEFGTVTVQLTDNACSDPLFGGLPNMFSAQLFHRQSVLHLPPGAQVLATSPQEPHQVVRFAERVWGVQFHPEFDEEIMADYLTFSREQLIEYGFDPAALQQGVRITPVAQALLQRFSQLTAGSNSLRSNFRSTL